MFIKAARTSDPHCEYTLNLNHVIYYHESELSVYATCFELSTGKQIHLNVQSGVIDNILLNRKLLEV